MNIAFITFIDNKNDINNDNSIIEYAHVDISLKDLEQSIEKEELYTLTMQSIINIKYILTPQLECNTSIDNINDNRISNCYENEKFKRFKSNYIITTLSKSNLSNDSIQIPKVKNFTKKNNVKFEEHTEPFFRAASPTKKSSLLNFIRPNKSNNNSKEDSKHLNIFNQIDNTTGNCNNINSCSSSMINNNNRISKPSCKDLNIQLFTLEKPSYELIESNLTIIDPLNIYSKEYISKINYSSIDYDTFANCIFISGLKHDNSNIIPNSNEYPSPCQHSQCSILSSFQPSLLWKYQNNKKKFMLDLTNLTSNLCFPLGIKVCYMGNNNQNFPTSYSTFLNVIKNEKGEMFYIVTLHYFRMMHIDEYDKKYKINPLREYTKIINEDHIQADQVKFALNLNIISSFITCESVYVPECITLVSRFPFINQMEICLKEIIKMSSDDMKGLINHLVNELPIPKKIKKMRFYIPKYSSPIDLSNPFMPNITNSNHCKMLFDHLSIENILFIFNLIILEQKILFIENDFKILGEISYAFMCFIYPFTWAHTYIPVLSLTTVKFLQSIIPFIMGIDEFLFKYAIDNECIDDVNAKIVYIRINSNTMSLSPLFKKKLSKKQILKELGIPTLPDTISSFLNSKLKDIKKSYNNKGATEIIEESLTELFIEVMARLIGDYQSHMFITDNEAPLFNSESYLNKKDKNDRKFYQELLQTQLFSQFLLNEKQLVSCDAKEQKNDLNQGDYGVMNNNSLIDTMHFKQVYDRYVKSMTIPKKTSKSRSNSLARSKRIGKHESSSKTNRTNDTIANTNTHVTNENIFIPNKTTMKRNDSSTQLSFHDITLHHKDTISTMATNTNDSIINKSNLIIPILISPYFINNPIIANDSQKIEEYINNSIKDNPSFSSLLNILPSYILNKTDSNSSIAMGIFPNITDCYRRYFPSMNNHNKKLLFNKEKTQQSPTIINESTLSIRRKAMSSKSIIKSLKSDSETKEISEWFTNICTAEMKNRFKLIDICILMKLDINREFFANLIKQSNTINNKIHTHKILNPSCFAELLKSIKSAFGYIEITEISNCKSLTIACFSYYKISNKHTVYIYEEYVNTYQPCRVWLTPDFWINWYFDELATATNADELDDEIIDDEEDDEEKEDNKRKSMTWKILITLEEIMVKIKMKKEYIKKVIINHLALKYLEQELLCEFEEEFILRRNY